MATKDLCCCCRLPRAELACEICAESVCRSCVERLADDTFEFLSEKPETLAKASYCPRCHDSIVAPALESYSETLERAKNVGFWARAYRGHVPITKRGLELIAVAGGRDRDEVILKMAFIAAQKGFNGLVQGELTAKKVRNHGYQKTEWSGRALPVHVDEEKLERAEFNEAHWRVIHHR